MFTDCGEKNFQKNLKIIKEYFFIPPNNILNIETIE